MKSFSEEQKKWVLDALDTLCRIFWGPDDELCEFLLGQAFVRSLKAPALPPACAPHDAPYRLKRFLSPYTDPAILCQDLETAYIRLFVSGRNGITAPLYASCYEFENAPLMGPPAHAMEKRYQSKGLSLDKRLGEPPDHIALELEYLWFLLKNGWAKNDEILLDEAASFSTEVISWVNRFREKLEGENQCRFYPLAASHLLTILECVSSMR